MRIDSHVVYSQEHPPEHLGAILTRNRFEGAILVGPFPESLADLPHVAGLVVPIEHLAQFVRHPKLRGVCCTLADGIPQGLEELALASIPLDVDLQAIHLPLVCEIARQHPALRIAIDNLASPSFQEPPSVEWQRGMTEASEFPNVYCKISGLLTDQRTPWTVGELFPFVRPVLTLFGPERVMFGSDWPRCLPVSTWKETLAAFTQSIGARTMEIREHLLGDTARKFYRL